MLVIQMGNFSSLFHYHYHYNHYHYFLIPYHSSVYLEIGQRCMFKMLIYVHGCGPGAVQLEVDSVFCYNDGLVFIHGKQIFEPNDEFLVYKRVYPL